MKNKLLNILKSIGATFLILFFPTIFFSILNVNITDISDKEYIFYLTLSNLTLIAIFILIYKNTLIEDFKKFIKKPIEHLETSFKYWFIGFIIMVVSNLIITYILNKGIAGNEQEVRRYIDSFPLFMIFNTVIYAPLTEELTFRKSFRDIINNKWFYALTSGLVFGMLHITSYINNWTDLIYLIPYGALGISFALLYHKTNNIFSTISVHAMHNLLAVVVYLIGASI